MLRSLVPSFNFLFSGVSIDQFTIVKKMPGKNMASGRFRYVAFPFHCMTQCFCLKKRVESSVWVTSTLLQNLCHVSLYFFPFEDKFPAIPLFLFLLPSLTLSLHCWTPSCICYLCWYWPEWIGVSDEDVSLFCKIPYVWENFWSYKGQLDISLKISINWILFSLSTFENLAV